MLFMWMLYITGSEKCLSDVARWKIKKAALGPSSLRFNYHEYLMAVETSVMHCDAPKNATVVTAQHSMPDNHPSPKYCPSRTINNHWTKPCQTLWWYTHHSWRYFKFTAVLLVGRHRKNHSCQLSEKKVSRKKKELERLFVKYCKLAPGA